MNLSSATMAVLGRFFLTLISVFVLESNLPAETMVYTGLVVTDVRVGATAMHNASLKITFEGDTNDIVAVPMVSSEECGGTPFYYLKKGVARMEIEFQGQTRTAQLYDGQVVVDLDQCNGGIGFGAFTGPNGFEVAYPLAFTLGTAEYAAITYSSPLSGALSVTGSAWSCIGYPPLGAGALNGTPSGNCIPPDTPTKYPLKSDIGDIFIYQPYYEFQNPGSAEIATNHAGSTNRGAFLVRPKTNAPVAALAASVSANSLESADASGVVYTLQTVADGSIGNHVFNQALVTVQMVSDTKWVTSQPSPVGARKLVYENKVGTATITVDDGGEAITAEFEPGEVYVRYDTGAGVAGFGSPISPTYPIALNCSDLAYPSDKSYLANKVDCVQGEAWNYSQFANDGFYTFALFRGGILAQLSGPVLPSPGVKGLRQSLSQNTLLTGTAHTCAGVYTIYPPIDSEPYFPGDLGVCGGPAPRGLKTSKGQLFLRDLEGGELSLGNLAPTGEAGSGGGWDLANSGYLRVELSKGDN